jgi:hypothetical protein
MGWWFMDIYILYYLIAGRLLGILGIIQIGGGLMVAILIYILA